MGDMVGLPPSPREVNSKIDSGLGAAAGGCNQGGPGHRRGHGRSLGSRSFVWPDAKWEGRSMVRSKSLQRLVSQFALCLSGWLS